MSAIAFASVTASIRAVLSESTEVVASAGVSTLRPDQLRDDTRRGINIFLFQASPNPEFRNAEVPLHIADSVAQTPVSAWDLVYLLTFLGDEDKLEPQRLMGAAIAQLQAAPVLLPEFIDGALDGEPGLAASNLAQQAVPVRLSVEALTLEGLERIWSLFQVPYRLSVVVRAGPVMVDASPPPAQRAVLQAVT
jgi:hypothetical protein